MKRLLAYLFLVLVLILNLQSWTKADDIRDFQIEGMSIGDSLLDYFPKKVILEKMLTDYASKKFSRLDIDREIDANFIDYNVYDGVQFHFKTKDKKFIIYSISAIIDYQDNVSDCYIKKKEIIKDLKELFPNAEKEDHGKTKHNDDSSGKSIVDEFYFYLKNDEPVRVSCFDWSEKTGLSDHLRISLLNKEIYDWFINEAY